MSVTVIAHRGLWTKQEEQNTLASFARAFDAGFGVELDVRDYSGELIVSHDPHVPRRGVTFMLFNEALALLGSRPNFLAVNVKSCGLAPWFAKIDPKPASKPLNWYFFDVALADEADYRKHKLPLWKANEWGANPVLVTSAELYEENAPPHLNHWNDLLNIRADIHLITDYPQEAKEFFGC